MTESQIQAVSLKLPTFWADQPKVWFAQAEAQFNLRNITADDTKYYYVVSALDQATAKRVSDFISAPPEKDKYDALKGRLNDTYGLSEFKCGTSLLHMPDLGDNKPSVLMDNMLALLDGHEPCFLFISLFLERMPEDIRSILAHSKLKDCRQLAKAADTLWETHQASSANAIRKQNATALRSSCTTKKTDLGDETARLSKQCFFHCKFGDKARNCSSPCSFSSSGNGQAGRQ